MFKDKLNSMFLFLKFQRGAFYCKHFYQPDKLSEWCNVNGAIQYPDFSFKDFACNERSSLPLFGKELLVLWRGFEMKLLFKSNFKLIIHMNRIDLSVYWVDSGTKTAAEGPEVVFVSLLNSYVDRSPWVVEKICHVKLKAKPSW